MLSIDHRFLEEYPDIKERQTEMIGRQRAYAAQVIKGRAFEEKINALLEQLFKEGKLPKHYTLQTFPAEFKFNADETRVDLMKGGKKRLTSKRGEVRPHTPLTSITLTRCDRLSNLPIK